MFITPENPTPTFNHYDPLMTGYLSQNQMGYLPNPGFMTPSSYGAFRTVPGANFASNQEMNPGFFRSLLIANQGMGLFNTYNPGVNSLRREVLAQRHVEDTLSAAGLGIGTAALSWGAGMAAGGIPGIVLGLGVGVGADFVSSAYLDRLRSIRNIQNATMSRITSGPDVSRGLGQGFSASAARQIDDSLRRMSAYDYYFDKEDYNAMFATGLSSGMFDMSNTSEQYIQTFKKLSKNLKLMMTLFETSDFQELGAQMQRMMAMGVRVQDMGHLAFTEKTAARMLGVSHGEAISTYGQQGALIANSMGLAGSIGSTSNLSYVSRLEAAKRAHLFTPAELSMLGGVSGAGQDLTTKQLSVLGSNNLKYLLVGALGSSGDLTKLDNKKLNDFLSGKFSGNLINEGLTNISNYMSSRGHEGWDELEHAASMILSNIQEQTKNAGPALDVLLLRLYENVFKPMGLTRDQMLRGFNYTPEQIAAFNNANSLEAIKAAITNTTQSLRETNRNEYYKNNPNGMVVFKQQLAVWAYNTKFMQHLDKQAADRAIEEEYRAANKAGVAPDYIGASGRHSIIGDLNTALHSFDPYNNPLTDGSGKDLFNDQKYLDSSNLNSDDSILKELFASLSPEARDDIKGNTIEEKYENFKKYFSSNVANGMFSGYSRSHLTNLRQSLVRTYYADNKYFNTFGGTPIADELRSLTKNMSEQDLQRLIGYNATQVSGDVLNNARIKAALNLAAKSNKYKYNYDMGISNLRYKLKGTDRELFDKLLAGNISSEDLNKITNLASQIRSRGVKNIEAIKNTDLYKDNADFLNQHNDTLSYLIDNPTAIDNIQGAYAEYQDLLDNYKKAQNYTLAMMLPREVFSGNGKVFDKQKALKYIEQHPGSKEAFILKSLIDNDINSLSYHYNYKISGAFMMNESNMVSPESRDALESSKMNLEMYQQILETIKNSTTTSQSNAQAIKELTNIMLQLNNTLNKVNNFLENAK